MLQEKWEQLIGRIKDDFKVIEHEARAGELPRETVEFIIFDGPAGRLKLERKKKPRVLGERTQYAARLGSQVSIEKVYSDDELVDAVKLFKDSRGEWEEMEMGTF